MQLHGLHHVTAVTAKVKDNLDFYTRTLGLRLVKKTVNQDDVSAYHLYYADKLGTPGTDMTFFDWPQTPPAQRGTDSIANTMFRVNGDAALNYWLARFDEYGVTHNDIEEFDGHRLIRFEDFEGQRLTLVDDHGADYEGELWDGAGVPLEVAIRGFYAVALSVPRLEPFEPIFAQLMNFEKVTTLPSLDDPEDQVSIYAMDGGGPGKEVHVTEQRNAPRAAPGYGGVHHVAFRMRDEAERDAWINKLNELGVRHSGVVERYYFQSVYFRISNGILFELATDEPGFSVDEPIESLGERLALPPFLEPHRAQIEANLVPVG